LQRGSFLVSFCMCLGFFTLFAVLFGFLRSPRSLHGRVCLFPEDDDPVIAAQFLNFG